MPHKSLANHITMENIKSAIAILSPLIVAVMFLISILATEVQLSEVRNELSIANNDTHVTLMYLKYKGEDGAVIKVSEWSIEDQAKYSDLLQSRRELEQIRKELSGIPEGLPK